MFPSNILSFQRPGTLWQSLKISANVDARWSTPLKIQLTSVFAPLKVVAHLGKAAYTISFGKGNVWSGEQTKKNAHVWVCFWTCQLCSRGLSTNRSPSDGWNTSSWGHMMPTCRSSPVRSSTREWKLTSLPNFDQPVLLITSPFHFRNFLHLF